MLSVVIDLGGTNIRFAVCNLRTGELSELKEFSCQEFIDFDSALMCYFARLKSEVKHVCIGIACPTDGDVIVMTNLNWQFSKKTIQKKFKLTSLYVINDYTAISLAVPFLSAEEKAQVGGGKIKKDGVKVVFGPGTGLGVSHLIKFSEKWISLDGEGGHASFTALTHEQTHILFLLQAKFGHVSAERLLSGQGIMNIYLCLCNLLDKKPQFNESKFITAAALNGSCDIAQKTLNIFCQIMGGFAGNLALNLASTGGVYIAGGIVPRFIDFFLSSEFRKYFEDKGRFKTYLSSIPTFLITHNNPGLLGASVHLRQEILGSN